jgi:hypothetical protein
VPNKVQFFDNGLNSISHILYQMNTDTIVAAVIKKFQERSDLGQKKYGTTLDRTDLKTLDWIQHAQEELMDGILYLEKLKQSYSQEAPVRPS